MRRLFFVLFAFLLLINVSWASCPSGQEENDRTGHCEPIEGIQQRSASNLTFETLAEGYCYYHNKPVSIESRRSGVFRFVYRFNCDELGGVLFDRQDCAIKDNRREGNTAFCLQAKENQNIKKVMAEYDIRRHILNTKRLAEKAKLVALRKISNSYCFVLPTDRQGSPPDPNLEVGWCVTDQVIRANRVLARTDKVSGSYCSAKNGMLFPEEACWEANLNRCVTLSDNIARTVLHKLGESEAYFLAEESDCNDAGGIVFEAKDCLEVTGSSFVAGGRYCGGVSKQQKADLIARSKVSQPYASTSETLTSTASSSSSEMVWCASRNAVSWVNKYTCWARYGGKAFPTESEALAEYKRLKAVSTRLLAKKKAEEEAARLLAQKKAEEEAARLLAKKKAEEEAAAQLAQAEPKQDATAMVDKSLELEFWQAIKDSDDPDEYQVYLDEFPTGKFSKLAKLRIKKLGITKVAKSSIPVINYGSYHALVIGNNDYDHLPKLKTAVNDADTVASVLRSDYGFIVKVVKNANRSQMLGSLAAFRKIVSPEDNFLLYYAGHGYLDKEANEGYWLPVDAEPEDPTNWLQNDTIVAQVRAMQAKHVMVVADSCFSGTMTRGLKLEQRTPGWLQKMVKKKARTALTSGGLEPVMDSGGGSHSVFAEAFIRLLEENGEVLDASQLFSQLRPKVMVNSDQTPEYGNIHKAGHGGGDFLFVRQ